MSTLSELRITRILGASSPRQLGVLMISLTENISLFPLHLVLFPGAFIPLHIYEERYKELISRSLNEKSYFGINLVEGTSMCTVGCTARVVEVLRSYDDGRMDIVVSGGRRYRLLRLDEDSAPVLQAFVEYFDDEPNMEFRQDVFEECVTLYNQIVDSVFHGEGSLIMQDGNPAAVNFSFLMAQKAGLQLSQKQVLLETRSESERLDLLLQHLKDIMPSLATKETVNSIVRLDGYLRQNSSWD